MHHYKMSQQIVGAVLVFLLLVGCGIPAVAPTPTLEAGWTRYERPTDGFVVALPPTWQPWDSETTDTAMNVAREQNPQMAALWDEVTRELGVNNLFKFVGMDFAPESAPTGLATTVIVFKQPTERSLDSYINVYTGWLDSSEEAIKPVIHWRVHLPAGVAEEVQFRRNMTALSGQASTTTVTQYLIIKSRDLYMLTFSTTSDQSEKYAPTFEKIARSFQWVK